MIDSGRQTTDAYLGLGTNLGDRKANLERAVQMIRERIGDIVALSSFVCTKPWGFESENKFLNAVVRVSTEMSPRAILAAAKEIEKEMGRTQKSVGGIYHDRIIDIDILLYGDLVLQSEDLVIPHPLMASRDFVMIPMAEIAPGLIHPVLGKTMLELSNPAERNT